MTFFSSPLQEIDNEIHEAINKELSRQQNQIELIASENIVSKAVLEAQGSVLTNKYAEGYAAARYYGGCEFVDIAEDLAIQRLKKKSYNYPILFILAACRLPSKSVFKNVSTRLNAVVSSITRAPKVKIFASLCSLANIVTSLL